jgi:hypothetical protein
MKNQLLVIKFILITILLAAFEDKASASSNPVNKVSNNSYIDSKTDQMDLSCEEDNPVEYSQILPRIEQSISSDFIRRNNSETKLLIPFYQNENASQLGYLDLRGKIDNSTAHQADLIAGYRKLLSNTSFLNQPQWIIGVYGGISSHYNYRKNELQQKILGIEALSQIYDFRVNFYIAKNKEKSIGEDSVALDDTDLLYDYDITSLKRQKALDGFDYELGYKLPISKFDLKIYAGGYYYQKPNSKIVLRQEASQPIDFILSNHDYKSVTGRKLRLELAFDHNNSKLISNKNTRLTFATEYKNDSLNQAQFFVMTKFSYQIGDNRAQIPVNNPTDLNYRMNEFIIKNDIMIDDKSQVIRKRGARYDGSDHTPGLEVGPPDPID